MQLVDYYGNKNSIVSFIIKVLEVSGVPLLELCNYQMRRQWRRHKFDSLLAFCMSSMQDYKTYIHTGLEKEWKQLIYMFLQWMDHVIPLEEEMCGYWRDSCYKYNIIPMSNTRCTLELPDCLYPSYHQCTLYSAQ